MKRPIKIILFQVVIVCASLLVLTCSNDPVGNDSTPANAPRCFAAAFPNNVSLDTIRLDSVAAKAGIVCAPGDTLLFVGIIVAEKTFTPASVGWAFGDSGHADTMISRHSYDKTGSFPAVFTITDRYGGSKSDTIIVWVNRAPDSVAIKTPAPESHVSNFNQVFFSWKGYDRDPFDTVLSYTLIASRSSLAYDTFLNNSRVDTFTAINKFSARDTIRWQVTAFDRFGKNRMSTMSRFIVGIDSGAVGDSCLSPPGLAATATSVSTIRVFWKRNTLSATWRVFRSSTSSGTFTAVSPAIPDTFFVDTGLQSGTIWYYQVSNLPITKGTLPMVSAETFSKPVITVQPTSRTVVEDDTVRFGVGAQCQPAPVFVWKRNGIALPDAPTTGTYTFVATMGDSGAVFRCIATNTAGTDSTNAIIVTVTRKPAKPLIITEPAAQTVLPGDTARFSLIAQGNPAPTFQWQRNNVNIPDAINRTLSFSAVKGDSGAVFRCIAINSNGTDTSIGVMLSVVTKRVAPTIQTQPHDTTITVGQTAVLQVFATGTSLYYQWYKENIVLNAATNASLSISNATISSAGQYKVAVMNTEDTIESTIARIRVKPATPSGLRADALSATAIRVAWQAATGASSYQLFRADSGSTTWGSARIIQDTAMVDSGLTEGKRYQYRLAATNPDGTSDTTPVVFAHTLAGPAITVSPADVSITLGQPASFSVTVTGDPAPGYQWFHNNAPIPNATQAAFSIASCSSADSGEYHVVITNTVRSVTSISVRLRISTFALSTTCAPTTGGQITRSKVAPDFVGDTIRLTATANSGYRFIGWTGDTTSTQASIVIKMTASKTVTAQFIRQFTLTTAAGGGGTVTPAGPITVDSGTTQTITATPTSASYRFLQWTGDTTGAISPISLKMNSNKTVTGTFKRRYSLSITAEGTGTVPGTTLVDSGTAFSISASATAPWFFYRWRLVSGVAVVADTTGATTTVTLNGGDAAIKGTFLIKFLKTYGTSLSESARSFVVDASGEYTLVGNGMNGSNLMMRVVHAGTTGEQTWSRFCGHDPANYSYAGSYAMIATTGDFVFGGGATYKFGPGGGGYVVRLSSDGGTVAWNGLVPDVGSIIGLRQRSDSDIMVGGSVLSDAWDICSARLTWADGQINGTPVVAGVANGIDERAWGFTKIPTGFVLTGEVAGQITTWKMDGTGAYNQGGPWSVAGYTTSKGNSVETTTGGGVVVAGVVTTASDPGEVVVIKYTADFVREWIYTATLPGTQELLSAVMTADGGYIAAGTTQNGGTKGILMIKLRANGTLEWQKTHAWATGDAVAYEVKQVADGGYVLCGYTTASGFGQADMLLMKTDPVGDVP